MEEQNMYEREQPRDMKFWGQYHSIRLARSWELSFISIDYRLSLQHYISITLFSLSTIFKQVKLRVSFSEGKLLSKSCLYDFSMFGWRKTNQYTKNVIYGSKATSLDRGNMTYPSGKKESIFLKPPNMKTSHFLSANFNGCYWLCPYLFMYV